MLDIVVVLFCCVRLSFNKLADLKSPINFLILEKCLHSNLLIMNAEKKTNEREKKSERDKHP